MSKYIFIVHPKSLAGKYNYSLLPIDKVHIVPKEAIYKSIELEKGEYTKEELEKICDKLTNQI